MLPCRSRTWLCATNRSAPEVRSKTPEIRPRRPPFWDRLAPPLARLVLSAGHRQARNSVISWHRAGLRRFWTGKVRRGQPGRPVIQKRSEVLSLYGRSGPLWNGPKTERSIFQTLRDVLCGYFRSEHSNEPARSSALHGGELCY